MSEEAMPFEEADCFSPESMAGSSKPGLIEVLSALLGRGADRRWGFGASYRSKV